MATKKIVNIYKVKQDIQGIPPSGISDDNFEKLNILNNTIDLKNISPWYNQYANTDGNFLEYEEPTNWYKKMYGIDTTWELMFNTESVYFRTEGSLASSGRSSSGLQGDAGRNATGMLGGTEYSLAGEPYGVFRRSDYLVSLGEAGKAALGRTHFDLSRSYTTTNEFRTINRLIRVYHLLSINGVNVSDIIGVE